MNSQFSVFAATISNPIKYKLFLLAKLPMAFFVGLKVVHLQPQQASVQVRFKWLNQNPFRSIYFAVLSMAAELSTGLLAFGQIYNRQPNVSMLVTKVEGNFFKKSVGKIVFTCQNGNEVMRAIEETITTKQGTTIICKSVGVNEKNEVVAEFYFTWSFKAK
jgi:hypothetical protein